MRRRNFLKAFGVVPLAGVAGGLTGCQYLHYEGFVNPCYTQQLPKHLRDHELVQSVWEGIDVNQVWDVHTHLVGTGDSQRGPWVNPNRETLDNFWLYVQFQFYINGSCANPKEYGTVDETFVSRLRQLHNDMPEGFRFMLLSFDYYHDEQGRINKMRSAFYIPNDYAISQVTLYPGQFEWIASIHPYREDSVDELARVKKYNARAIKWLPGAMGINPASPLCDRFYDALVKYDMSLLVHAGEEHAVEVPEEQRYENPLLLRRALEKGVRVIFAHCATLGSSVDTDISNKAGRVSNLDLFARLMDEPQYAKQVFGDISAITQVNRDEDMITKIITRQDWHERLLYGSDYPLPGVMPLYSPLQFVYWGMLSEAQSEVLSEVRQFNPALFDFMLKRLISVDGQRFGNSVFESRKFFIG